jgi:heat shock protein HslJ
MMSDNPWLRYGLIGLLAVGFLFLIGFALNSGGAIEGPNWTVEQLTAEGAEVQPIEGTALTAVFDDGTVSGLAGCNNFTGGYTLDGDSITIGPLASTLAFCDGIMDQEQLYLTLLQSSTTYEVDGDKLTLSSGGSASLIFSEGEASGS